METNGISLFDQQPEEPKKDHRTAFLLGGLAALGVAGALGVGFVVGGRGGDGSRGAVDAASVRPAQTVPASPTAKPQMQFVNVQPAGQAPAVGSASSSGGATGDGAGQPTSNSGDTSGASDTSSAGDGPADPPPPPAPTNTPIPPTSTPTNTPEPPTHTPTSTPTATATPHVVPCAWCPIIDPLPFDPGIIHLLDFTPPVFSSIDYVNCLFSHTVSFSVNEDSELWVTYDHNGMPQETGHGNGMGIGFNLGAGFLWDTYDNVVLHAKDNAGNVATLAPAPSPCF